MISDNASAEALARKILLYSRKRIAGGAPFLLPALYVLPDQVSDTPGPLYTDGAAIRFDPQQVIEAFQTDHDLPSKQLLHIITHCLLGHVETRQNYDRKRAFDQAADLKVNQFIQGIRFRALAGNCYLTDLPHFRSLYNRILNSAKSYRKDSLRCRSDDHSHWPGPESEQTSSDGSLGQSTDRPDWTNVRLAMLDGSGIFPGNCTGLLTECFTAEKSPLSYSQFLQQFAIPTERMLLDPDSFDPRWYHLGLSLYGNTPLLEPSEFSEVPQPDNIVIALDTSGSCSGEICKRFLSETLSILQDISAGASRFQILMLQCDTKIQSEVLLESPEQVEELFQNFEARGFGGTDFRPVFQRVEELQANGVLPKVRGLLYLSDSFGDFPDAPPDYPTVFLIPGEQHRFCNPNLPNWITQLYFNPNDFILEEAHS